MSQMRRCSESEMAVDGLDSRTEYSVRVCPIRLCQDGEIPGAYSPSKTFLTPSSQAQHQSTIDSQQNSSSQVKKKKYCESLKKDLKAGPRPTVAPRVAKLLKLVFES